MKLLLIVFCVAFAGTVLFLYGEWMRRVILSGVLIIQAQPFERIIPGAPAIVIMGDSTAYGTGSRDPQSSIAGRIGADFTEYSIVNHGKNGQTVRELLESMERIDLPDSTAVLLIQIGGNDILRSTDLSSLADDLNALLSHATAKVPQIIVMTSGNVGGAEAFAPYGSTRSKMLEERTLHVREIFIEASMRHGVEYIDLYTPPGEDVFIQEPERYMAFDGLHPSGEGYGVWYAKLLPVLKTQLK